MTLTTSSEIAAKSMEVERGRCNEHKCTPWCKSCMVMSKDKCTDVRETARFCAQMCLVAESSMSLAPALMAACWRMELGSLTIFRCFAPNCF